jgi:phosphomannomutase
MKKYKDKTFITRNVIGLLFSSHMLSSLQQTEMKQGRTVIKKQYTNEGTQLSASELMTPKVLTTRSECTRIYCNHI